MKLGLIGRPLGHSKSPQIHRMLTGASYSLWPLEPEELAEFLEKRDFGGINVTIPYKRSVMEHLDEISEEALAIGAVNTVVNRGGRLIGFNTDMPGLRKLLEDLKTPVKGAKVAILGSGGAAAAARTAAASLGGEPFIVSRDPARAKEKFKGTAEAISYEDLLRSSCSVLINTTPVGLSPNIDGMPLDPEGIPGLKAVVDVIANPLRTRLMQRAEELGLETAGGLKMLVAQAFYAEELFLEKKLDEGLIESCTRELERQSRNIVLIGMPSAGKTTIGRLLSKKLSMPFTDMDEELTKRFGTSIAEYFRLHGEASFRKEEAELAKELSLREGLVIATGGGAVKSAENMRRLAANCIIVWIDRSLEKLQGTKDRPLSQNASDLERLWAERKGLYEKYSDIHIRANAAAEDAAESIIRSIS